MAEKKIRQRGLLHSICRGAHLYGFLIVFRSLDQSRQSPDISKELLVAPPVRFTTWNQWGQNHHAMSTSPIQPKHLLVIVVYNWVFAGFD